MQASNLELLQIDTHDNVHQELDELSSDARDSLHIVMPFLDKGVYENMEDPEYQIQEEIKYNKAILMDGLFSLSVAYDKFKA